MNQAETFDKKFFMNLSGSDFFLIGLFFGCLFNTFTTISLVLLFLLMTNRQIAGVETWTYIQIGYHFLYHLIKSSLPIKHSEVVTEVKVEIPLEIKKKNRKRKEKNISENNIQVVENVNSEK